MVSHEGAIYVASNKGYNWKAAVQETVSATLNRFFIVGASCYTGTFSAVNCAHALNHNSIDTMQSYWQPSNRAVARRIQNMGWRADGLLWLLVRGGEFILATALGRGFGILDVGCRSEEEAWEAGESGILLRTRNGGKSWNRDKVANNIAANLYAVK
ncbi:hypothetical protein YC2023_113588 [Brassica napus]|uniref:(rape) hypothetical protein n=1 Tax=Brassica napus TaxID=3708 RepID=A0A816IT09_BRANA|nr:unnamed protein product [Brassica napus]